jgi:DNA-binding CsgD family transcriptional regulator
LSPSKISGRARCDHPSFVVSSTGVQRLNSRDLHRLVDAVAEIGPLPDVEPFPVESLDLFGVLSRATQDEASGLDRVTRALSTVAESGAEPSLLVVGHAGRIGFIQSAGRRLLGSYFGDRMPGRLPKLIEDWATDAAAPDELVVDGVEGQLVVSALSRDSGGPTVALLHERPWELPRSGRLTERELEVLALVDEGKTNAEIAHILWVAPCTIRKHLENAYAKLGVNSRTEATALLRREAAQAKNY